MSTTPQQIIVGVDERPQTAKVVAWAAREAVLRRSSILLVHAVGSQVATHLDIGEDLGTVINRASADGQRIIDRARAEIRALAPGLTVEDSVSLSTSATALAHVGSVGSMVVVGPRSGRAGSTLDGLGVQLDGDLGCHLVEVTAAPTADGVLAISDGTVWAMPILDAAFELAALHGLSLTVVHCPEPDADPGLQRFLRTVLTDQVHQLIDCYPTAEVDLVTEPTAVRAALAAAPATASHVVADAALVDELPQTCVRMLVHTERRPEVVDEPAPAPTQVGGARRERTDVTAELESWWQLPAAEPAVKPALVRVRRRHLRRFGSEA